MLNAGCELPVFALWHTGSCIRIYTMSSSCWQLLGGLIVVSGWCIVSDAVVHLGMPYPVHCHIVWVQLMLSECSILIIWLSEPLAAKGALFFWGGDSNDYTLVV